MENRIRGDMPETSRERLTRFDQRKSGKTQMYELIEHDVISGLHIVRMYTGVTENICLS